MKLLISNDDGIFSLGVRTLANTLAEAGHQVTVVCPDRERSATGHGLTLHDPIRVDRVESLFHPSIQAWACSGTPSDCVKLALDGLLDEVPDAVFSGINHGANLGTDVLYSGTVSAAMEGLLENIPSVAFSLTSHKATDFQPAANFARSLIDQMKENPWPQPMLLNVNVPPVAEEAIAGVALTRQGVRRYFDQFEKRTDPRGKIYYWLTGELLEEVDDPTEEFTAWPNTQLEPVDRAWLQTMATDVQAIRRNYITVTPLQYNQTCGTGLQQLRSWWPDLK